MIQLPAGWRTDRLKDCCRVNRTNLAPSSDPDLQIRYLEISNVDYFGVVDPAAIETLRFEDAPSRARRVVSAGDTIISSVRPNLQAVAYMEESGLICSTGFNVVTPLPHRMVSKFLYYCLISDLSRQYLESVATGVGYPAVGDKFFGCLVLPLPPRPVQAQIVAYLDAALSVTDKVGAARGSESVSEQSLGILARQVRAVLAYRRALISECVTGRRLVTESDLNRVRRYV